MTDTAGRNPPVMPPGRELEFGGGCGNLRAACPWIPDEHCSSCHNFDEEMELEHDGKWYLVCCSVLHNYALKAVEATNA